jgi:tetratricopeptide (TPR) repeat protein
MPRVIVIAAALAWSALVGAQTVPRGDAVSDCFTGSGSPRRDVGDCTRAMAAPRDPLTYATLLGRRAHAFGLLGELEAARLDLEAAIASFPLSAEAFRQLGSIRSRLGDESGAEEAFSRAIALNPRYAEFHRDRGVARLYAGRLGKAEGDLAAALARNPDDPETLMFHGFVLFAMARYREASERFDRCAALGYPYVYLTLWRAMARARSGGDARGLLRQASDVLSPEEWPRALLLAFLDPAKAADAVRGAPPARRDEASFYLAAWTLSREGEETSLRRFADERVRRTLEQVSSRGDRHSIAVLMAGIELARRR